MRVSTWIVLLFCLAGSLSAVGQATITSNAVVGAWNVGGSWVGGVPPSPADHAIIVSGATITNAGFNCQNITINGTGILSVTASMLCQNVTINGTGTLSLTSGGAKTMSVGGDLTMNGNSQIDGSNNNQQLPIAGNFSVPAGQSGTVGGVRFTVNGFTNINGYFAFANAATGNKFFNNTITVAAGGTWDNLVGEDPRVNCDIVNNGSWPAPTGGNGIYQVSVNGTSYTYSGTQPINFTSLDLTSGTGTTITNLGTLVLNRNGGGSVLNVGAGRTFNNGDGTATATLQINGTSSFTVGGTVNFTPLNNTVDYMLAGAQSNLLATTYNILKASTSGTKTLQGATTVNTEVNISGSAILDVNTTTLSGAANLVMTGTSELQMGKIAATLPELTGSVNSLAAGTTITFNAAGAQTAKGSSATNPSSTNVYPYQNINISGNNAASSVNFSSVSLVSGNLNFSNLGKMNSNPLLTVLGTFNFAPGAATTTLANNITVGNIIFSGGTLAYSNRSITVNGNNGTWTNNGGTTTTNANSNVIFTTGTNQQITGSNLTAFQDLTINNSNGVTLNGINTQVQSDMTFTLGNIITGANNIYVSGTVSRTSGHVDGNLQKDVPTGAPSVTFEVGTGATYAPVNLTFVAVGTAGTLICSSTALDHPDVNASNIEPNKTVNRYWSLTNSNIVFTSYSATFNFAGGIPVDLDAAATPANFIIKRLNGLNWFTTTVGTRTGTSTQFIGEVAANLPNLVKQDFQIGEIIITTGIFNRLTGTINWTNRLTWIENRTGTATFTNLSTAVTGTGTLFSTELAVGDSIMLQTSPGTLRGRVASITNDTNLTLSANATATISGGYGRTRIPNAIGDVVTIGNSNIADVLTTVSYNMASPTLINTLNINTSAAPRTTAQNVTHAVANLLTIQTAANVNQPGGNATDAWNINAGSATVSGNLTIGTAVNNNLRIAQINISTGTLTAGNVTFNTSTAASNELSAVVDMSTGAGRFNLLGQLTFANNRGRLIPGANSTFNYLRSASGQRINAPSGNTTATNWIYNNVRLNNTSAAGAFVQAGDDISTSAGAGQIFVNGDIRIETGSMITSTNTDIAGGATKTFQIDPSATFSMTGASSTFPTAFGTFSLGTTAPFGLVSYGQTNAVTVASPAGGYGSLQFVNNSTATLPVTLVVAGHLTVGNGVAAPTLRGNATTAFTISNNVTINTGGTIDANANGRIRSFNIAGNWSNSGTFTPSGNAADAGVVFNGTGTKTIGGTSADGFFRLVINTAAAIDLVQMQKAISVSDVITFTLGGLDLNGNILSITNKAATSIVRTGGYAKSENTSAPYGGISWHVGNLSGVNLVYPFGKSSTEYIPFTFRPTTGGAPVNGPTMTISTYATANDNTPYPATVTNLFGTSGGMSVVDRFWVITESGYTTRPTATMTFTAVGGSAPTLRPPSERPETIADLSTVAASPAGIAAQRWNPAVFWETALPGQTFANNTPAANFFQVAVPGVTSFSPWTLADISAPLPIQLVHFDAGIVSGRVVINWRTESELNNDFFEVQKTMDTETFQPVANLKGGGTTTTPKNYSVFDGHPQSGRWYYRLKQTDFDGKFTFSKLVAVDVPESFFLSVHPNPSNGDEIFVTLSSDDIGKSVWLKIQDLNGKEMLVLSTHKLETQEIRVAIPEKLAPGMYIISIAVDQQVRRQKLVVR